MPNAPELTLDELYSQFPDDSDRPSIDMLAPNDVPEPYHKLLVHTHHMTVTVEDYYGEAVDVQVLEAHVYETRYIRKILLSLHKSKKIVQFGIVQIDLTLLSAKVRDEITNQRTPLGRVLIQNKVLRRVHPVGYFRAKLKPKMATWLGLPKPEITYGRLGVIYTDHKPAIRVAEILTPIHEKL